MTIPEEKMKKTSLFILFLLLETVAYSQQNDSTLIVLKSIFKELNQKYPSNTSKKEILKYEESNGPAFHLMPCDQNGCKGAIKSYSSHIYSRKVKNKDSEILDKHIYSVVGEFIDIHIEILIYKNDSFAKVDKAIIDSLIYSYGPQGGGECFPRTELRDSRYFQVGNSVIRLINYAHSGKEYDDFIENFHQLIKSHEQKTRLH